MELKWVLTSREKGKRRGKFASTGKDLEKHENKLIQTERKKRYRRKS